MSIKRNWSRHGSEVVIRWYQRFFCSPLRDSSSRLRPQRGKKNHWYQGRVKINCNLLLLFERKVRLGIFLRFCDSFLKILVCLSFDCAIVASDIQSTWWRILAQFSTRACQRTHYCRLLLTLRLVSSWLHVRHALCLTKSSRCRCLPLLLFTSVPSSSFVYATIPNLVSFIMLPLITIR